MRLHGVDFSGASDGGSGGIRVAERELGNPHPISAVRRMHRAGLRQAILDSREDGEQHFWLIDAPFGVARETLEACGIGASWRETADWFTRSGNPREWRRAVRAHTRKEVRRTADRVARTPMAPMNLRVFKQTWTAVTELLLPLSESGVRVEPLVGPRSSVVVSEGCPASVLSRMGGLTRGYKGKGDPPRERRLEILRLLARRGVKVNEAVAEVCLADEQGDSLDAVILCSSPWQGPVPGESVIEGWVY